jgi:pimeloyl-ACP methyl ester carboxylesterase
MWCAIRTSCGISLDDMTSSERTVWHYRDTGTGRPLVLLHGIGMSHAAWNPVTPYLRETRRVIAFDVAGFGLTPPLPEGTRPTIATLVAALARLAGVAQVIADGTR